MTSEQIAQQIAEFERNGGKVNRIETGLGARHFTGGKFNKTPNHTKNGGVGITIKGRDR